MKACRVHRFGPPEVIEFEEIARPVPGPGQLLVEVRAAGVGPWDAWVRSGKSVIDQPLPLIPGSDLAGTVAEVGPNAAGFAPGDAVFGVTNAAFTGAYAEYALVDADRVATKPRELDFVQAAAAPVVAVTALQMLFEHAQLAPKQRVLIHGAGGSVGACAVQFALAAGATVIGTQTQRDLAYVRSLGVHQAIAAQERFEQQIDAVDVVLDLVGGELQARSYAVLKRGGALISAVSEPDAAQAAKHGVRAEFLLVDVRTAALERVARSMQTGELSLRIAAELPLSEARIAHEMLEGTRPRPAGKLVLRVR
jgi:NADPH:quinone reductase-like Zn-dependent oxidoreductase